MYIARAHVLNCQMSQGSPHREGGGLAENQAVFFGELSCPVSLLPQVGPHCRRIIIDYTQAGVEKQPVRTGKTIPDLPHLKICVRYIYTATGT